MSSADPRWAAPQSEPVAAYRPRRLAYGLAGLMVLVLLVGLAAPAAVGYRLARQRATGAAPAQPGTATVGGSGLGDPYFPNYGNGGYEVAKYVVSVSFDPRTATLTGTTTIDAHATQDLDSFFYDLVLDTDSVTVDGVDARSERSGFLDTKITPASRVPAGHDFEVVVRYSGRPAKINGPGGRHPWSVTNQEWTAAGEPESAAWWYPSNDYPTDPALMDVSVRVPKGLQAVSNGRLESADSGTEADFDTWHWVSRQPMAPYLSFITIGRYEMSQGTSDGRPFVYAVTEQLSAADRRKAMAKLAETPKIIGQLSTWFGPYPFSEIGGVVPAHKLGFGGLENQTRPVYAAGAILDDDFSSDLLAHELSHMWFGDNVTVKQWDDVCTNECWASWGQWAYRESVGGEKIDDHLRRVYARLKGDSSYWMITLDDPGADHLFDVVYTRGPMMLQALRHRMGDQAFFALARGWAQAPGSRSLEDWMAKAQSLTTVDLNPFFQVWIYGDTAPADTPENGFR
jgi:aminopeptidase N